jgi:hypothetical protein
MALCINQSGTWRVITTQCINDSGTWRKVVTGCINESGVWRRYGFAIIPTVTLTASPATIAQGSSSTLTWSSTNATSVTSSNFGATTVTGSTSVSPSFTSFYTITVQSSTGDPATSGTTVTVVQPPTITLSASPSSILQGSSSTLTWSSANATAVTTSNFGAGAVSGSTSVSPSATTTYTITVRNICNVTATANSTVTVNTLATAPLGSSACGGFLVRRFASYAWIVSPYSSEVSRNWYDRNDANTRAQQVSGCTGWFVPDTSFLACSLCSKNYWDNYSTTRYWSNTEGSANGAQYGNSTFQTFYGTINKSQIYCVRAFRCVAY